MSSSKIKCALVVGHSKDSQGAVNKRTGITEYQFNKALAEDIQDAVNADLIAVIIIERTHGYNHLPAQINRYEPDFIISLHCNAFDKKTSGCETLYYHSSSVSRRMALILNTIIVKTLGTKDRGLKARQSEDRGAHLLKNTSAPCVIAEPFFIDNDKDFNNAIKKRSELVKGFVCAIDLIAKKYLAET